jgi:hypothetical protein
LTVSGSHKWGDGPQDTESVMNFLTEKPVEMAVNYSPISGRIGKVSTHKQGHIRNDTP